MVTMAMSMFSTVTPGMEMVSALQTVLKSMSMSVSRSISMLMFLVTKSLLVRKLVLLHHRFGIHTIVIGVVLIMMMVIMMMIPVFVMHKVVAAMLGHEGKNDGENNEFHAASLATTAIATAFLVAGGTNSGGAGNKASLEIFILVCDDRDVGEYFGLGLRTHDEWMDN